MEHLESHDCIPVISTAWRGLWISPAHWITTKSFSDIMTWWMDYISALIPHPDMHWNFSELFFSFSFLFCIGVQLINSVVTVSGEQKSDLPICIPVSILPQTPLPSRLPHSAEQSSLCFVAFWNVSALPSELTILNPPIHPQVAVQLWF